MESPRRPGESLRRTRWCALLLILAGCGTVGVVRQEREWAEVEPTIAHEMTLDNGQIVILDLRAAGEFNGDLGHLRGAISTPLETLRGKIPEILPYRRDTVLVYADAASDAVDGVRILVAANFTSVILVRGGIRAWIERGYETVSHP